MKVRRSIMIPPQCMRRKIRPDRKSTRLNSSHANISYAVFCLKKKKQIDNGRPRPHEYHDTAFHDTHLYDHVGQRPLHAAYGANAHKQTHANHSAPAACTTHTS